MHILLIDDSSSTRSLLRTLINSGQAIKHDISEAASGEEALQKVASGEINLPDLIIADINMGGMSGFELCREFRLRHGTTSDINPYIIIVTANEGVDVINQALDSGANDYMSKPVNVKILHVRLRVAERLMALAQAGISTNPHSAQGQPPAPAPESPPPAAPVSDVDPREAQIGAAVEQADAPMALVDIGGGFFNIAYANQALTASTQFGQDQLIGKSLAELEAWTPDFLNMVSRFISRGAILSHVPLWSRTRQAVPVHLSFYPVHDGEDTVKQYLVIHHF